MSGLKSQIINGCGIITINRPQVLNALNIQTVDELKIEFRKFRSNDEVGVIILTGEGEKAFIAGADIQEIASLGTVEAVEFARKGQDLTNFIERFPKPVIAAINGFALGGGCEVALACHIRIAAENARFGQPEVKLGIIPGWGGTQRLPRLIGRGLAIELITTGEIITAQEAKEIGLVNHIVPQSELISKALEVALLILKNSPEAVRLTLESIHRGSEQSQSEGLVYESYLFGYAFSTADKEEGTKAFLEKRPPNFKR